MNLDKLDADERNLCLGLGEDLTGICFSFDFSNKMSLNLPKLSPEDRDRLLDKMVFYKIFFVESTCRKELDAAHCNCLIEGITNTLRRKLSADKFAALEDELLACSKIPFNEAAVSQLARHAGISTKAFTDDDWKQLKVWVGAEILGISIAVDAATKHLNTPPHERKSPNPSSAQPARAAQPARKKNSWSKWLPVLVVLIALLAFNYIRSHDESPEQNPPKSVSEPVAKVGVTTGYVDDHPILNNDGLCEFTVDNTQNDMPVYVRIWDVDAQQPVRAFTIAEGRKFTAENLSPGTYEVRYMYLRGNNAPSYGNKSEPTTLEQHGTSYSTVSLTLYKVTGGNTTTTRIDADDV